MDFPIPQFGGEGEPMSRFSFPRDEWFAIAESLNEHGAYYLAGLIRGLAWHWDAGRGPMVLMLNGNGATAVRHCAACAGVGRLGRPANAPLALEEADGARAVDEAVRFLMGGGGG